MKFLNYLKKLFWNSSGRIGVFDWWMASVIAYIPLVNWFFLSEETVSDSQAAFLLFSLIFLTYCKVIAGIKRLHDLNKSGWFIILSYVPFINLVMFVYLGFFPTAVREGIQK